MTMLTSAQAQEAASEVAFVAAGEVTDAINGTTVTMIVTETVIEMTGARSAEIGAVDLEVLLVNLARGAM
jgi:hypothetical protein